MSVYSAIAFSFDRRCMYARQRPRLFGVYAGYSLAGLFATVDCILLAPAIDDQLAVLREKILPFLDQYGQLLYTINARSTLETKTAFLQVSESIQYILAETDRRRNNLATKCPTVRFFMEHLMFRDHLFAFPFQYEAFMLECLRCIDLLEWQKGVDDYDEYFYTAKRNAVFAIHADHNALMMADLSPSKRWIQVKGNLDLLTLDRIVVEQVDLVQALAKSRWQKYH